MKKIRTIIVEDEEPARDILKHYLIDHPGIEIVSECADGFTGLKSITELKPDLLFLDIQMPKLTGFEMLEVLDEKPVIIFTTAYDQYAIKAFELNAADYLLKPFSNERLAEALKKAKTKIESGQVPSGNILQRKPHTAGAVTRIVVRKGNSIQIIPVENVKYLESQDDYVMVYYGIEKALKQETMKFYEQNLPPSDFVRIHRSYIVKVKEIKRIEPYGKDNHIAILNSGERLPVSHAGYSRLKNELNF